MRRFMKVLALSGLVFAVGACDLFDEGLEVENQNAPDQQRALSSSTDVESLIGSSFRNWFYGFSRAYPAWALSVAADETTSSWGNYGMQHISSEPRTAWANSTGYSYRGVAQTPWYEMYGVISAVNDGLAAIDAGLEIGENGADNQRAIAFGKFMQALAHGYLALHFDRAFVFTEDMDLESTEFELQDYKEVMAAALQMLDDAIAEAGKGSFSIPEAWIPAGRSLTNQDLIRMANSYYARLMTANARTKQERDALNWGNVTSRIDAGIKEDFGIVLDNTNWTDLIKNYTQRFDWFRSDYKSIGPSDISGAYQAWLATPVDQRIDFDMNSADRRIQGTGGVGTNGTDFTYRRTQNHRADRGTYHFSRYHHSRFMYIRQTNIGFDPLMQVSEMDLLKAEALIRAGQNQAAADLINKTRVAQGKLPPATASGVSGTDCVPKKLFDAAGGCADLWQTMIYEKRISQYVVATGVAFWDARGWGILVPGTVLHLPIPARELETLGMDLYTFGGVGNPGSAGN